MGFLPCLLFALVHTYFANGYPLEKPIALSILSKDLQSLEAAYPTADLWPQKRIIKYNDGLEIVVAFDHSTPQSSAKTFLTVVGKVTVAQMKKLPKGFHEMANKQEIRKLYFHGSWFFFNNQESDPILNLDNYYIIDYLPLLGRAQNKPTIEYVPESEIENELLDFIPRIRYESSLSGAKILKTAFRMKNGIKLDVQYDQQNDIATFKADYHVLVMTDQRNVVKESVKLDKLSFYLYKQSSPELSKLGVIYGVRVAPLPTKPSYVSGDLLKVKRDMLLKDMVESTPVQKHDSSDMTGIIKYDVGKIYTVNYILTNKKTVLSLGGAFLANDGSAFNRLCVAFPGGQADRKGTKWFRNSDVFSENPVFFSCSPDNTENAQVVLQEDTDYIELVVVQRTASDIAKKFSTVEPYLEYIPYEKFLQTMLIVTNALKLKCAKGYPRRSYRLYADIFLNYDCNTGIAYFDLLDLWIGPGRASSFVWQNLPGVSFDTNTERFESDMGVLTDFKIRQLRPVFPDKVAQDFRYTTFTGTTNLAFELKSVEWDLQETRDNLLKNLLPQWGVVRADDFVLFVAEKSKEVIGGQNVWTIVIKCDVSRPETCPTRECAEKDQIIYDGNTIMMRNSRATEPKEVPNKVYWPNTYKLPILNDAFSVSYQIRYIKLPTFKRHMKEVADTLQKQCVAFNKKGESDAKLTLYIYYFNNKKEPIVGFYDCVLHYTSFVSEFKVIKFPNLHGISTAYRPGEEAAIGLPAAPRSSLGLPPVPYFDDVNLNQNMDRTQQVFESEDEQLRRKHSAYILQDLLYDPVDNILHSKSMFLTDVYALRGLPTQVRDSSRKSALFRMKVRGGPEVHVY